MVHNQPALRSGYNNNQIRRVMFGYRTYNLPVQNDRGSDIRRETFGIQKKRRLDVRKSSRTFQDVVRDMRTQVRGPMFRYLAPQQRRTARRNGRARLKRFGDNQRCLYKLLMNAVSEEYPVFASGMQPADEVTDKYIQMNQNTYADWLSSFQDHLYKLNDLWGYELQEQADRLSTLGLHRTVSVILDLKEWKKSKDFYQEKRANEVQKMLNRHLNCIGKVLRAPLYSLLLQPISYDGFRELRKKFDSPQDQLDANVRAVIRSHGR